MNTFGIQRSFRNSRDTGYQNPGSTVLLVQILKQIHWKFSKVVMKLKRGRIESESKV